MHGPRATEDAAQVARLLRIRELNHDRRAAAITFPVLVQPALSAPAKADPNDAHDMRPIESIVCDTT